MSICPLILVIMLCAMSNLNSFGVHSAGNKASATVEPFLLLPLDIYPDAVRTIEDALKLFCAPETLEGYRPSATGKVSYALTFSLSL